MRQPPFNILLVEDNEVNRRLLTRFLEKHGFRVVAVSDGTEALRAMHGEPVDLVLLDIVMPGMSGLEVLRALRRLHGPRELPVIMATAKDDSDDVVKAFELGASDYITKPLVLPIVLARIQAQLRMRAPVPSGQEETTGSAPKLGPGAVLAGKYQLVSVIGKGNYGVVFRATHLQLRRQVAIKLLRADFETHPSSLARLEREGISACRIQHPNAVSVLDFHTTDEGTAFLVMELLEGHSLEDELNRIVRLKPQRVIEIIVPVCNVLAEVHAQAIIHRDIKPHNIFLHQTLQGEVVKVLDFGIAKLVGESALSQNLTLDGMVTGTPAYMAPERIASESYDSRSDLYSLGVVLFELLAGRRPFTVEDGNAIKLLAMHVYDPPPLLSRFIPGIGVELERIVARLLAKNPDERPTATELGQLLSSLSSVPLSPA